MASREKKVDDLIPTAVEAMNKVGIIKILNSDGTGKYLPKEYRGKIASFGAAVVTGSLISAVSLFSDPNKPTSSNLMKAIYYVLKDVANSEQMNDFTGKPDQLYNYIVENRSDQKKVKVEILKAATALKLAMRLYPTEKPKEEGGNAGE